MLLDSKISDSQQVTKLLTTHNFPEVNLPESVFPFLPSATQPVPLRYQIFILTNNPIYF